MKQKPLSYDVDGAQCGCKAGQGPKASCKHISALCYAFVEFCTSGHTPDFLTCTEHLQEWNIPRARRVEVIPVDQLSLRRLQIQKKNSLQRQSPANYDPRPLSMCSVDTSLLHEHLRTDLLNEGSVFSQILVPLVSVALHDHNRYSNLRRMECVQLHRQIAVSNIIIKSLQWSAL